MKFKFPKIRISKKLAVALIVGNIIILNDYFGWEIDLTTIKQVVTLACTYIIGQGAVDVAKGLNGK